MKKNQLRLNQTLTALVDEFILCNEPVSSRVLNEKYLQEVSSATLRLDLMKLEEKNLIYQPHTSAGRIPTIKGYRQYLQMIAPEHNKVTFRGMDLLREMLIKHYKDTPLALHYIMQLLARETDQLSFVAEPEVSNGYLAKLDVFSIGNRKYIFVMSLDSGLDKTVVMKLDYEITEGQLRKLVRYLNDELAGLRIYDIANKVLVEMRENMYQDNALVSMFLRELHKAFIDISDFYINYDGSINFLEQPEFDSKHVILSFMNLIQRQDSLLSLMRKSDAGAGARILMGEDFNVPEWSAFSVIFGRYEVFGIPGYLGVVTPLRTDYRKLIPLIRDITKTITETTRKGMMVVK
ncbi:MAG TPA: heat-inducible transcriptional repressor HrcA [Candidatus Cloacimonadota bacterium]|jgi:heat-inducible transcriptional repressor|nr:heat-inducible transcriptional repressor HrcA [Candidatus Cloacimonadota bacterium]HOF59595.1 heat-inducible transcriptional repressor HrcA [Candidatus Cloacimonadota bacterium]HOR59433.1 heat-inducible transcriptional repressor HrcA [Candidatus Cloacimonadota bacterium]HPB09237.1 heat-inducible transcriptional repressor HrcA [Candidatus Cloacimonadota bacterium]HPL23725.1 heat-inducible transcriptional repressor HrcA [Candidatus Cloacimonadota bacterium]